jgi:hypothetical protein
MGTHVSQVLDRRVGVADETRSRRSEVKSWRRQGRVGCTVIQKKKEILLSAYEVEHQASGV